MIALRNRTYRKHLDHLTDAAWEWAVSVCSRRTWFPSVEELEMAAGEMPMSQVSVRALLERTPEMIEADMERRRQNARGALTLIEEELRKRGIAVGEAAKDMPEADVVKR